MLDYVSPHLSLDVVEVRLDRRDDGLDARELALGHDLQPLPLAEQHGKQLQSARDERGQPLLLFAGQRVQEALEVFAAQQYRGELGQHARIHRIGLGQTAHQLGVLARLALVDHRHRQAYGLQRAGQLGFLAAGGLHHYQRNTQVACTSCATRSPMPTGCHAAWSARPLPPSSCARAPRTDVQWRAVADRFCDSLPKLAKMMDAAEYEAPSYLAFPGAHWLQIRCTNPPERLNAEFNDRTNMVGLLPIDAITHLLGVTLKHNDGRSLSRRCPQL